MQYFSTSDFITRIENLNTEFWNWVNDRLGPWASHHLGNIIGILFIAWLTRRFGGQLAMRFISTTVRHDLYPTDSDRKKRIRTLQSLVTAIFRVGTWGVALLLVVSEVRPNYAGTLFASAGIIGVALGFGAQSLIKDFMSGIFIILENQYRVGDTVTLDKVSGTVEGISMRTTTLRDADGSVHHVPNGTITVTTNKTMDYGRMNELLVVGADTDLDKFEAMINKIGKDMISMPELETKLSEPPHFDRVNGIDAKGDIIVRITAKTTPSAQWRVKSEFYKRLRASAKKANISFHS